MKPVKKISHGLGRYRNNQGSLRDRFFISGPGTAVTISHGNARDFLDGNWPSRYHRDGNKTSR